MIGDKDRERNLLIGAGIWFVVISALLWLQKWLESAAAGP